MKLTVAILALLWCLTGCAGPQTYETLTDTLTIPQDSEPMQIHLELPETAVSPTLQTDTGDRLYLCDGYWIALQTLSSGDLNRSLQELTGYDLEALSPVQTVQDGADCYDCVWTLAGEGQTQTGRLRLLDDGNYHYAVTVIADADQAGRLQDQIGTLFRSVSLEQPSFNPNTGS